MANSAIRRHLCEVVAHAMPGALVAVAETGDGLTNVVVREKCPDCGQPLTFGLSLISKRLPEYLLDTDHVVRALEQQAIESHH